MELQCCGEYEAERRKCKSKPLTIQKYLDFCEYHKHSDLTADHLRKIISIHGFKSLRKVKKEVLIDAVDSIKLMDLTRSTINDDTVSSYAFITSEEAIKDLICLNWIECSVTSFKTLNSDLISLQNAGTFGSKMLSMKKKRAKMIKPKEGIQPVCSLASGDQCSVAKGSIGDCAAADYVSSSSLLPEEGGERPTRKRQAPGRLEGNDWDSEYSDPYFNGTLCEQVQPSTKDDDVDDHFSKSKLGASNITLVTDMDKWEEMLSEADEAGKIVLVNFSADWCNPCRDVLPVFRSLAETYTSIMFLIVDVDELAEFSTSWEIKATPTFFFLKDGQEVDKLVGANKEELKRRTDVMAKSLTNSRSLVSNRDQNSSQSRTEDNAKMQNASTNQTSSHRTDNDAKMQKGPTKQTSIQRRTDDNAKMQNVGTN